MFLKRFLKKGIEVSNNPIFVPNKKIKLMQDIEMRMAERKSLNRLCDISDWCVGGDLTNIMKELGEGSYIHRKSWEYALCVYGLNYMGVVKPDSVAISVGAGHERPLFYYANRIKEMVATDLYNTPGLEGEPRFLTHPEEFAPFPYRKDHLTIHQMSGTDLRFEDNTFDFAFTLSSIEHFGGRKNSRKAMHEIYRVLKPGGVACITTELLLNNSTHPEYFTYKELEETIIRATDFRLVGGDIDFRISSSIFYNPIELDVEKNIQISPHIVLKHGENIWTSINLFFLKPR